VTEQIFGHARTENAGRARADDDLSFNTLVFDDLHCLAPFSSFLPSWHSFNVLAHIITFPDGPHHRDTQIISER
jgi:hypothetical protein